LTKNLKPGLLKGRLSEIKKVYCKIMVLASLISSVILRGYLSYKELETRLAKRQTVRDKGVYCKKIFVR
ncbi:unnamed protein product, partial [Sphenostylis stenocarpa]